MSQTSALGVAPAARPGIARIDHVAGLDVDVLDAELTPAPKLAAELVPAAGLTAGLGAHGAGLAAPPVLEPPQPPPVPHPLPDMTHEDLPSIGSATAPSAMTVPIGMAPLVRPLPPDPEAAAGIIFGCTSSTYDECFDLGMVGLPQAARRPPGS